MSRSRKKAVAKEDKEEGLGLDFDFTLANNPSAFYSHPEGQEASEKYKADNNELNLRDLKKSIGEQIALLNKNSSEFKKSETTATANKCLQQATVSFKKIQSDIVNKSIDLDDEAKVALSKFKDTAKHLLAEMGTVYALNQKTSSREATDALTKNIADFCNKYSPEEKKGYEPPT